MATLTNQSKNASSPANQAKTTMVSGAGVVFFGWLFFFTVPGTITPISWSNQPRNAASLTNQSKN